MLHYMPLYKEAQAIWPERCREKEREGYKEKVCVGAEKRRETCRKWLTVLGVYEGSYPLITSHLMDRTDSKVRGN